ncbi:MAG TPA: hypothetical protein VLB73_03945 [Patescibacteria group bacterium]|nr:hypothetical protein [Patescibacteria group bacterium]
MPLERPGFFPLRLRSRRNHEKAQPVVWGEPPKEQLIFPRSRLVEMPKQEREKVPEKHETAQAPLPEKTSILHDFFAQEEKVTQLQSALLTPTDIEPHEYIAYALTYLRTVGKMSARSTLSFAGFEVGTNVIPWESLPVEGLPLVGPAMSVIRLATILALTFAPLVIRSKHPLKDGKEFVKTAFQFITGDTHSRMQQNDLRREYPEKNPVEIALIVKLEAQLKGNQKAQERIMEIQKEHPGMSRPDALGLLIQQEYVKDKKAELDALAKKYPEASEQELIAISEMGRIVEQNHKRIAFLQKKFPGISQDQLITILQVEQLQESKKFNMHKMAAINYLKAGVSIAAIALFVTFFLPHIAAGSAAILATTLAGLGINAARRVLVSLLTATTPTKIAWRLKKWTSMKDSMTAEDKANVQEVVDGLLES